MFATRSFLKSYVRETRLAAAGSLFFLLSPLLSHDIKFFHFDSILNSIWERGIYVNDPDVTTLGGAGRRGQRGQRRHGARGREAGRRG